MILYVAILPVRIFIIFFARETGLHILHLMISSPQHRIMNVEHSAYMYVATNRPTLFGSLITAQSLVAHGTLFLTPILSLNLYLRDFV